MSQTLALPRGLELPGGGRLLRVGSVDAVALEARAGELAKRSIKRESKLFALELAIRMMDLTTLEGADTPGKVRALCTWFTKGLDGGSHLRIAVNAAPTIADVRELVERFFTAPETFAAHGLLADDPAEETAVPAGR